MFVPGKLRQGLCRTRGLWYATGQDTCPSRWQPAFPLHSLRTGECTSMTNNFALRYIRWSTGQWVRRGSLWLCLGLLVLCAAACTAEENGFVPPSVSPIAFQVPTPLSTPAPAAEDPPATPALATGFTEDGFPYLGSPTAPIVVVEYSDFHCPYCQRHNQETFPQYRENFIRTGKVQYIVKDLPLESLHPQARSAHRAAWCAALQDTDAFWWMHSQLYATQAQHARAENPLAFFEALAVTYNDLPPAGQSLDIHAFMACQQDYRNEVNRHIDHAIEEAQDLGITGTPTFLIYYREDPDKVLPISGAYEYEVFEDVTNHLEPYLARMEEEAAAQGELPYWISEEGLLPERLWLEIPDSAPEGADLIWEGVTRAQDHFKGSPAAQVVVFEFSDFQCPYCRQHQENTQSALDAAYVRPGKIMWIYKHFPLDIHAYAPSAAEAALCAGEQGRFWAMHKRLFAYPDEWAHADYLATFLVYGQELAADATGADRMEVQVPSPMTADPAAWERTALPAFDVNQFETCLANNAYQQVIVQSMEDVSGVVQGTPTFLVWHRRYGLLTQPLVGSQPEEQFTSIFEQIFAQLAELEGTDP